MSRKHRPERGATLVEYALGVALILVASLGAISTLTDDAGDRLGERSGDIGAPGDEALGGFGGGSGNGPDGDDGEVPPPPPPAPYNGAIVVGTCTAPGPNQSACSFSLDTDPAPQVPTWSANPAHPDVDGSGTLGSTATLTFKKAGTYSVRATVGTTLVQVEMRCTKAGSVLTCVQLTS